MLKGRIVLREIHLRTTERHLSTGSHSVPATRQRWPPTLTPTGQVGTWFIDAKDEGLSWPEHMHVNNLLKIVTQRQQYCWCWLGSNPRHQTMCRRPT